MQGLVAGRVNDCAIKLANVNGTGSASANSLLMQSIFRMGIPVSGKNLFPSNIQGLPTWYEIRVNRTGFTSRAIDYDLMVAMNAQTYDRDIREVRDGGYVMYDSSWPLDDVLQRSNVHFLGIPLAAMCNEHFAGARQRILMKNIVYAGALVAVLNVDMQIVSELVLEKFAGKEKLRASNQLALQLGHEYALAHFECPLPFHLERMDTSSSNILIDGNTATALGCVYAGATVAAWYPITPATSVMDAFKGFCDRFRRDPDTGVSNYVVVQAEDELASIGMVIGASWNGARAFTSTAGPGISLMNELLGLAYYAEVPAVVFDVQRTGPSTGMPTRTQQGDILECAYASHGDTKHILLFPAHPGECFEFARNAFDLAEHFQTPVIVLSDLDIGMNDWVVPQLQWDDGYEPDRGKVLTREDLEEIGAYYRYTSDSADHVAPRTLPGVHPAGAYFTRGSGHNRFGEYTETPAEYQEVVDRLAAKHQAAARSVPAPVVRRRELASIGVITVGSCELAVLEALESLARQRDGSPLVVADYMRVRAFPFGESVRAFLDMHDLCFVVEQNRDAQLRSLLILEAGGVPARLRSILAYGGFPLSAVQVTEGILNQVGSEVSCHPS